MRVITQVYIRLNFARKSGLNNIMTFRYFQTRHNRSPRSNAFVLCTTVLLDFKSRK